MDNLLNENKIILNESIGPGPVSSILRNFEPKIISLMDRITLKESNNLNFKFDSLNLPGTTTLSNLNEKFTYIIETYIDRSIAMPKEVTEFVTNLIKILGEKDEVFAKDVASELLVGFEEIMKSGKLLKDGAFESFNLKFGENITNRLKVEYREILFKSIDGKYDIKNLTQREITDFAKSIKDGTPFFKNLKNIVIPKKLDSLISSVENIKKLMLSLENPNVQGNEEVQTDLVNDIISNMTKFATTYHNEVEYLMGVLKTHSELSSTSNVFKKAYKTISEYPMVYRKLEILAKSTGNNQKFSILNNVWQGVKSSFNFNKFLKKANKTPYISKTQAKLDFNDIPKFDQAGKLISGTKFENLKDVKSLSNALGYGSSKGIKFSNPAWEKVITEYTKKGARIQLATELIIRYFKFQLLLGFFNTLISEIPGIWSVFGAEGMEKKAKGCMSGMRRLDTTTMLRNYKEGSMKFGSMKFTEEQDKKLIEIQKEANLTGNTHNYLTKDQQTKVEKIMGPPKTHSVINKKNIPSDCFDNYAIKQFILIQYINVKYNDLNQVKGLYKNISQSIVNSSETKTLADIAPGVVFSIAEFLWQTKFGTTESTDDDKSKFEAESIKILNSIKSENEKVLEDVKKFNEAIVLPTDSMTNVPQTDTLTSAPTNTFTPQPPPQVEYEPNEQSFKEFLNTKTPPETYKSYNSDTKFWFSKDAKYKFKDGTFEFMKKTN